MGHDLNGQTIAFLVADEGVEQVELTEPWKAVEQAGGKPELISPEGGTVQAFNHLDKGDTFEADTGLDDADASRYDGLVLPGGVANPDMLRTDPRAVELVKAFFTAERPVAVICHGPWTLVEADVAQGAHHHVVAVASHRHPKRRRHLGRRDRERRRRPREQPKAGRPAGVLRRDA